MNIAVLDLKINNYQSILLALSKVISNQDTLEAVENGDSDFRADLIVLPGLGHFASGMQALRDSKLDQYISRFTEQNSKIVGICLGMQLLGLSSEEAPGVRGLGLLNAHSYKLPDLARVPHIGWNSVNLIKEEAVFPSLTQGKDFYFVHSYHVQLDNPFQTLTSTQFGSSQFCSSFLDTNIAGFQFHPEKSGLIGRQLLADIYQWAATSQ